MSKSIIEQAETIARALTEHKQIDKAVQELRQIQNGRATRTLSYLELDHHTLNKAIGMAESDSDDSYTRLTYEVNKGTQDG